jgi:hypothetical protein
MLQHIPRLLASCRCLAIPLLSPRSFDLIFLDANKDGYTGYYGAIMQHCLLAHNGLLVVDNSLMKVGWPPPGGGLLAQYDGCCGHTCRGIRDSILVQGWCHVLLGYATVGSVDCQAVCHQGAVRGVAAANHITGIATLLLVPRKIVLCT